MKSAQAFGAPLEAWFEKRGWVPAPFQRRAWRHYLKGDSGLIVTATGSGKTLAAFGGPLLRAMHESTTQATRKQRRHTQILWVTPLKALANDTAESLRAPMAALGVDWEVAVRTGDASNRDRRLARQGKAEVVIITPESLALQLSYEDAKDAYAQIHTIIVDEWHELLGSKRGVLLELCLAHLRDWQPSLQTWGVSATLGNLEQARDVLIPHLPVSKSPIVGAAKPRRLIIDTLLPLEKKSFPWAGHLGLSQLAEVQQRIEAANASILFTNTRSQAELWHRALEASWLGNPEALGIHHGSISKELRHEAERSLKEGRAKCVVATSSLDLGVDFPAVDQVFQIGSPKGIWRLMQRGGRAKHRPGEAGTVICVPTHALEVIEYAAARSALAKAQVESRKPLRLSLDVLAQHCITLALAGGFDPESLLVEVRSTYAFKTLTDAQWASVLKFIVQGGAALEHYPEYRRVEVIEGRYVVSDRRIALRHRLSIGTITSDGHLAVKLLKGGYLGSVEESFLSRLKPRDVFQFAGRSLELVRLEGMTAHVRLAKKSSRNVPRWQGGRMPMSSELAHEMEAILASPPASREMRASSALLHIQAKLSDVPTPSILLSEQHKTREGHHLMVFPFAGRAVHEGLAAILALRLARMEPNTFSFAVNDYGLMLTSTRPFSLDASQLSSALSSEHLVEDLLASLNLAEMARRQFREVARVAGLLPPSLPGRAARSMRQLQASAGLIYDVLQTHDPNHLLLEQATREVLEQQLDFELLNETLARCSRKQVVLNRPKTLTPFAFPLWTEFLRGSLSTENWKSRVQRAVQRLEAAYD